MAVAGRPRSDESHKAILQAAYELLAESGFAAFTFERVAALAGVSRSTIYRWWPSKGALAMESTLGALNAAYQPDPAAPALEQLRTRFHIVARAFKGPTGRIVASMLAESQRDPETLAAFTQNYIEPARASMRELLRRAIAAGELRADFDIELAMDFAFGTLYHQLLLGRSMEPDWIERFADFLLGASQL